jgi:hypothetical protein
MYKDVYRNNAALEMQKYARPFGGRANITSPSSSYAIGIKIPDNFNWIQSTHEDDEDTRKIKSIILRPNDQASCGNCYAVATAAVLSDLFTIKYGYKTNPDLSASFMNANYPELGGCQGGDPVQALDKLYKEGTVSNKCVDNSVCITNSKCNGKSSAFSDTRLNGLYEQIGKGCYINDKMQHMIYHPKKSDNKDEVSFNIYPNYDKALMDEVYHGYINDIPEFIKHDGGRLNKFPEGWKVLPDSQHEGRVQIYKNGPGIGLLLVTSNFMDDFFRHDAFIDVFDGIFLDRVVWNKDGTYTTHDPRNVKVNNPHQTGPITFDGGHAVAVIGYGISSKPIPIMDFSENKVVYKHVPFWWVRNSWSTDWNPTGGLRKGSEKTEMAGCVKIAMYPFNKVAQFDVPIDQHTQEYAIPSRHTGYIYGLGGIIFTEAGDKPKPYKITESNNYKKTHPDLRDTSSYLNIPYFYNFGAPTDEYIVPKGVVKNFMGETSGKRNKHNKLFILHIVFLIIGLWLVYKFCLKKRF